MAQETPREWYQCLADGTAAVRRPHEVRKFRRPGLPRFSIWHIPSFQDCFGWTVYQIRGKGEYKLQTVTWRQVADSQRMEELMKGRPNPTLGVPTLDEIYGDIDVQWFERKYAALAALNIPLITKRGISCDGEAFGVHVQGQFEVEWQNEPPPEWAELGKWTQDCISQFRRMLP